MSAKNDSSLGAVSVTLKEANESFLDGSLDLTSILKNVKKHQKAAIEKLVSLMDSEDQKIAFSAAKSLLDMEIQLSKEMNTDKLQRLIAQAKFSTGSRKTLLSVEDQDDMPIVDFTTIKEIK